MIIIDDVANERYITKNYYEPGLEYYRQSIILTDVIQVTSVNFHALFLVLSVIFTVIALKL